MCVSSCFLFHSLPQWEFLSECINKDASQVYLARPGTNVLLLQIPPFCSYLKFPLWWFILQILSVALTVFKVIVMFESLIHVQWGMDRSVCLWMPILARAQREGITASQSFTIVL